MKKILYLLEYPIDLPGGAQMSTQSLCEGLQGRYEVMAVCPPLLTKKAADYSFPVIEYPASENRENKKIYRIKNLVQRIYHYQRIVSRECPDIVHIQMPESAITYGFLRTLGFFRHIRFVFTDRGLYYGYRKHSLLMLKNALKYTDRFLCTTAYNRRLWEQNTGIRGIEVISNTIGEVFTEYSEEKRSNIRQACGLSDHDLVLGFAGRVCEEKNWPLVKVICERLAKKNISFKVALVMSVFEEGDQAVVEQTVKDLKDLLGEENILFDQDLSQEEMADYYYKVDVFIMTSRFESFGKAAVEAMSRRCAVISTDVGGLREVVEKKENLYSENDVSKCVDYIEKMYWSEYQRLLERDKKYFYLRYLEKYTLKKCLEEHNRLYDSL